MNDFTTTMRMLLTTAVVAAVAALLAGPASAFVMDVEGGGGSGAATAVAQPQVEPGTIPYLSHGIGVDQRLFQGEQSLGLTGDSALTRVVGKEPQGLTGDGALTRGEVFQANATSLTSDDEVNWTWVGFGAGMAALLAAAMGALYLSARNRDRVALP